MNRAHFEVVADVDQRHWWFLGRRRILREVLHAVIPAHAGSVIIDVGCGTGANIASLADDYRCIGIDVSPDAIAFARERFPKVEFICGMAPQDLGSIASSAQAMLLMDVLEHVENDRAVLSPLVASLSPGAFLLITVPADMRLWSSHDVGLLHYRRYDAKMLQSAWEGLSVEPIAMTHFCSRLYPLARVERAIGRVRDRIRPRTAWEMRVPAAPFNRILERTFAREAPVVVDVVRGRRHRGYSHGVSLLALLRRTENLPSPRA